MMSLTAEEKLNVLLETGEYEFVKEKLTKDELWKLMFLAYSCMNEEKTRWIPCSERLPEESGRYFISVFDGVRKRTTVAPYHPRCKAWTMTGRMAYWKVVAWMPLPEPYKAEDKKDDLGRIH